MPARYVDFEVLSHSVVAAEKDLVHLALFADAEPIEFRDAIEKKSGKKQ